MILRYTDVKRFLQIVFLSLMGTRGCYTDTNSIMSKETLYTTYAAWCPVPVSICIQYIPDHGPAIMSTHANITGQCWGEKKCFTDDGNANHFQKVSLCFPVCGLSVQRNVMESFQDALVRMQQNSRCKNTTTSEKIRDSTSPRFIFISAGPLKSTQRDESSRPFDITWTHW